MPSLIFFSPSGSFKQAGPAFAARCDVLRQQSHPAPVQAPPFPSSYFQDEVAAEVNSAEALFTLEAHCGYASTHCSMARDILYTISSSTLAAHELPRIHPI